MNAIVQAQLDRRCQRAYTTEMPSDEDIQTIIEAGIWAPSGMDRQSSIIVAVTNRELRDRLSHMNAAVMGKGDEEGFDPFYGAPVVLVVLGDKSMPTYVYDGSLAMGNLMLAADALGLGCCWIHRAKEVFDTPEGKQILADLGVEGDYEGIGNCVIGVPAGEKPEPKPRHNGRVFFAK